LELSETLPTPSAPAITTTRVVLADAQEIFRRGVRRALEARKDWEIVGEAGTGAEAMKLAEELEPDVMIVDIGLPGLSTLEGLRRILEIAPRTEVLIVSTDESEELLRDALEAGARGYLLKSDASRRIVEAVDALSLHRSFLTSGMKEVVLMGYLSGRPLKGGAVGPRLTRREREIVALLAEGNTSKEVATTLGISPKTAETHRTNIMRKLDLHSVSELVRYAVRNRIIKA
jgi:DNA-binding NarL/FixJ family response regulator